MGTPMTEQNIYLINYFSYADSIIIYKNGEAEEFNNQTEEFNLLLDSFLNICKDHHEMPALGVSLHNETIEALNNGIWIEFRFNKIYTHNDMPFSRLLIEVNNEFSGFNIIRYHNNEYNGRCFYLNLNNNMSDLYNSIIKL